MSNRNRELQLVGACCRKSTKSDWEAGSGQASHSRDLQEAGREHWEQGGSEGKKSLGEQKLALGILRPGGEQNREVETDCKEAAPGQLTVRSQNPEHQMHQDGA